MERALTVERLYNLGDFKSIRVGETLRGSRRVENEIQGIPEELWLNPEFINKLRYLQLVQTEATYFRYIEDFVKQFHAGKTLEDVLGIIDTLGELEVKTITELKDILEIGE